MTGYARDFGFAETRADLEDFLFLLSAMDSEFLAHEAEQAKKQAGKQYGDE